MGRNTLNVSFLCLFRRASNEMCINEVRAEVEVVFGDGTVFKHTMLPTFFFPPFL